MADWIIIVDDDTIVLKTAGQILSKAGMRVTALKSGKQVLDYVRCNGCPDLIFIMSLNKCGNSELIAYAHVFTYLFFGKNGTDKEHCLRTEELSEYALVGELSLSGGVRRVRGIIPIVVEMRRIGRRAVLVPEENAEEASVVSGIDVIPVRTLVEAVKYLSGELEIEPHSTDLASLVAADEGHGDDFAHRRWLSLESFPTVG